MLLLIDASRANNEQKTGVEWYGFFVIQELKKIVPLETRVILYTREPLKGELANLPPNWQERVLHWPPRRLWTQIRLSWEIWRVKMGARNYTVGVPEKEIVLFVPAHVLPLVCPTRTFITIHDLGGLRFPAGYSLFEKLYARFATWFALRRAIVFTPSEFSKREIQSVFGKWKIIVVPNGFDRDNYYLINDKEKIKQILGKYNIKSPYFISISRLEEKKNTVGIVEAYKIFQEKMLLKSNLENYSLVLLGKPGYGYTKVKEAIIKSGYQHTIIIPGWVEAEDVPYLMAGATGFVFPSFYEGFGIPILEAMACGVPVVASNRAALSEVANGAALLVDPYKPVDIAQAMLEIVSSSALKEELVGRGLARAREFGWKKTASGIWDMFVG
ncbi:MAG: glycosyltransferase family 4 protein [Candidatus Magasanikbacteria bacterium]|nr:glycosyltransferase family 4 protein [Candidatus Magasanikbacteria bacterium]